MRQPYNETMNRIQSTDAFKAQIKRELSVLCKAKAKQRSKRMPFIAAACVAAAAAAVAFIIPVLSAPPSADDTLALVSEPPLVSEETPAQVPEVFGDVTACAFSPENKQMAFTLPNIALTDETETYPSLGGYDLPVIFYDADGQRIESVSGIDLVVSGDEIDTVTYSSKNFEIFYEDSRNWKTSDGDLIWSSYDLFLSKAQLPEPTQESVIKTLAAMQFSENAFEREMIRKFVDRLYSQEVADIGEQHGDIDALLDEKMQQPIDFSRYEIDCRFAESKKPGVEGCYIITIVNPANPPTAPVTSRSVTVQQGECVTWMFDAATIKALIGKSKDEAHLSDYSDEISVTATNKNGQSRTQVWPISFTEEGKLLLLDEMPAGSE